MMIDFVARQVPADPAHRTRLELATGQRDVPALVDPEQGMVVTEADDIIAYLDETYGQRRAAPGGNAPVAPAPPCATSGSRWSGGRVRALTRRGGRFP